MRLGFSLEIRQKGGLKFASLDETRGNPIVCFIKWGVTFYEMGGIKNGQVRGGFALKWTSRGGKWTSRGGNYRGRECRKLLLNFN